MQTFSEKEAGAAFHRLAASRLRSEQSVRPSDVCLYAWLVAEAARENVNPIQTTTSDLFRGFEARGDGKAVKVYPVGLALNTIKVGLERLEEYGFIAIERTTVPRGERLDIEIK